MLMQEAAISAELDASIAPKTKPAAARADPVASFEDAAWEAALAPVTKKAKDSGADYECYYAGSVVAVVMLALVLCVLWCRECACV